MAVNEEEIKIRERLGILETKLDFLSDLLKEIKDGLRDTPSKDSFQEAEKRIKKLESNQTSMLIKIGIFSGVLGMIGGMLIKYIMI